MFNLRLCYAATTIRYFHLKFGHMHLCGMDYKYFSSHCCKCNSFGCTVAIRCGNACHGPHSSSLYSGGEYSQFNSPRLVKREAGFPNPRRALIGSNQLWRVNDSPYYRELELYKIMHVCQVILTLTFDSGVHIVELQGFQTAKKWLCICPKKSVLASCLSFLFKGLGLFQNETCFQNYLIFFFSWVVMLALWLRVFMGSLIRPVNVNYCHRFANFCLVNTAMLIRGVCQLCAMETYYTRGRQSTSSCPHQQDPYWTPQIAL